MQAKLKKKMIALITSVAMAGCLMQVAVAGSASATGSVNGYPTSAYLYCDYSSVSASTSMSGNPDASKHVTVVATGHMIPSSGGSMTHKTKTSSSTSVCSVSISPDVNKIFVSASSTHTAGYLNYSWTKSLTCPSGN